MARAISSNERKMGDQAEASANTAPEVNRKEAFSAILAYAKPHKLAFFSIFLCTLFAISADLLQPYLVKIAIDDHLMKETQHMNDLLLIGGVLLALSVVSLFFTYVQNNLLQYVGQNIVSRIRKDLFEHISKLSMSFFDRYPIGSLVTHESSDTETINQFFTQVFLSLIRDGMTLIFILVLMFQLDPTLAWYSLLLLPIIAVIAVFFRKALRNAYQQARTRLSRMIAFLAENLAGMSLIQVFHQEKEQMKQFTERNESYLEANLREIRTNVMFNRSFDILGNMAVAVLVWLGGMAVFNTTIEFGVLYAFISYIRLFFQPINQITQQWNTLQSTTVSVDRLWRIFSTKPVVDDKPSGQIQTLPMETVKGKVDYNRIRFTYDHETDVIRDIDLHISPGEFIGIVGATGAGKSSLMNLLNRFYDVTEGSICIDGIDVRSIPQAELHRIVGLVQQEPYLYSGSIIDNIRLFDETIPREAVIEACRFVGASEMIERLKDGYDTRLSERGSGLSAGERQLLSFARIVVYRPKILILDEATANLDSHTEQAVQRALEKVSQGRTTLVIAHRLSTIMHADRIIVMQNGRIVEQGTHQELVDSNGEYAELYSHSRGSRKAEAHKLPHSQEALT